MIGDVYLLICIFSSIQTKVIDHKVFPVVIVGNKRDLEDQRVVRKNQTKALTNGSFLLTQMRLLLSGVGGRGETAGCSVQLQVAGGLSKAATQRGRSFLGPRSADSGSCKINRIKRFPFHVRQTQHLTVLVSFQSCPFRSSSSFPFVL